MDYIFAVTFTTFSPPYAYASITQECLSWCVLILVRQKMWNLTNHKTSNINFEIMTTNYLESDKWVLLKSMHFCVCTDSYLKCLYILYVIYMCIRGWYVSIEVIVRQEQKRSHCTCFISFIKQPQTKTHVKQCALLRACVCVCVTLCGFI